MTRKGERMAAWLERNRGRLVAVSVLLLLFVVGVLSVRAINEPDRTQAAIDRNTAAIRRVLEQQEKEIRGDCPFKRQVAMLPSLTERRTDAVVSLASAARDAYIIKGCAAAGFGPVPPRFRPTG